MDLKAEFEKIAEGHISLEKDHLGGYLNEKTTTAFALYELLRMNLPDPSGAYRAWREYHGLPSRSSVFFQYLDQLYSAEVQRVYDVFDIAYTDKANILTQLKSRMFILSGQCAFNRLIDEGILQ